MSLDPASDEALAVAAQSGCRASFEQLVARLQGPLLGYLRRSVATLEDAEDLVQESFVRAFRNLHHYRTAWRFSTWLFTIARRLQINEYHRAQTRSQVTEPARGEAGQAQSRRSEMNEAIDAAGGPAARLEAFEERAQLWQIAQRVLTEPQCSALWLYYVEELPVLEIARVLGRTRMGVKTILFRARQKLMPALQQLQSDVPAVVDDAGQEDESSPPESTQRETLKRAVAVPSGTSQW